MGLMESIEYIITLLTGIQNQLDLLIKYCDDNIHLTRSIIDLSAIDVAALEKNVSLLASYKDDIDYIIECLERLSGNIHILFWLLISICVLIIAICLYFIINILVNNKDKIFDIFRSFAQWKKK